LLGLSKILLNEIAGFLRPFRGVAAVCVSAAELPMIPRPWERESMTLRATTTRPAAPFASWTAPAKRSGDGAFARTHGPRAFEDPCPSESGVALVDFAAEDAEDAEFGAAEGGGAAIPAGDGGDGHGSGVRRCGGIAGTEAREGRLRCGGSLTLRAGHGLGQGC